MNSIEEDIKILEVENYYLEELGYLRENNHFIKFNQALKHLIKAYKELEEKQIIKNEQIRNGQPVIANTRLTVLDVLYLITEFIKRHEEEFRRDYVDISINQIISAIDYFIDNSIPVSLVEETIEEYTKLLKNCNRFSDIDRIKAINERIIAYKELLEKR